MGEAGKLITGAFLFGLCSSLVWLGIDYLEGRPLRSDYFVIFVVATVAWSIGRVSRS